jgi:hypothetical protein
MTGLRLLSADSSESLNRQVADKTTDMSTMSEFRSSSVQTPEQVVG